MPVPALGAPFLEDVGVPLSHPLLAQQQPPVRNFGKDHYNKELWEKPTSNVCVFLSHLPTGRHVAPAVFNDVFAAPVVLVLPRVPRRPPPRRTARRRSGARTAGSAADAQMERFGVGFGLGVWSVEIVRCFGLFWVCEQEGRQNLWK